MPEDGYGTDTRRPGAWKPLSELRCAVGWRIENSLAFAVGEPVAYVQAPKAKGHGDRVLTGFSNSPTSGYRVVCGGAPQTFSSLPAEELC
jgi:hypothetical protein